MFSRIVVGLFLVLVFVTRVVAQTSCPPFFFSWSWAGQSGSSGSASGACSAAAALEDANLAMSWGNHSASCIGISETAVAWTGTMHDTFGTPGNPDRTSDVSISGTVSGSPCVNSCGSSAGKTFIVAGKSGPVHGEFPASDGCEYHSTDGGFKYIMANGVGTLQTAVGDGTDGSGTASESVGPQVTAGVDTNACITSSTGTSCLDLRADGHNCGVYNGDAVCLGDVPNNSCVSYASGGVACTVGNGTTAVTSPPVPDNGTAGTPATPAASVVADNGTTTNYYTGAAVKGSSTPTVTSGNSSATLGTGTSGTSNTQQQTPSSKDCAFLGTCSAGDLPAMPQVNDVQTSTSSYMSAITSAPIVQAFSNISASIPSGTCPAPQFTIWGHNFTMDAACSIFDQVSSVLSAICLIVYTIMAARVFMSA